MKSGLVRRRWKIFCAFSAVLLLLFLYHSPVAQITHSNGDNLSIRPPGGLSKVEQSALSINSHHDDSVKSSDSTSIDIRDNTRTLVIARTKLEDTSWTSRFSPDSDLTLKIYTVDDPSPGNPVPRNKGNEAMAYLTHIITNYSNLTTITIFTHAHRNAWHNNDLLDSDAIKVIQHLSTSYVLRQGYTSLRCHHFPGCPSHIFPTKSNIDFGGSDDLEVPEAKVMHAAWIELFPTEPVPDSLASPCCAQFAVSRERILSIPLSKYVNLRDWLIETPLDDHISGRVFEWMWHYLWTGIHEVCPKEHICYCDGFGVCFGGEKEYNAFFALRDKASGLWAEVNKLDGGKDSEDGKALLQEEAAVEAKLIELKAGAFERGKDPSNRALEAGRPWKDGDDS